MKEYEDIITTDLVGGQDKYTLPDYCLSVIWVKVNGVKQKINYPIFDRIITITPSETDIKDGLQVKINSLNSY